MANKLMFFYKSTHNILGALNTLSRQSVTGAGVTKILGVRHLYSRTTLGIDSYSQQRERTKQQLSNIAPKFREKMAEYSSEDSKNMVFTEDLKNMLHLAEDNADIELIIKMLKRFNQQNKELRFGSFIFGPVIMRTFHFLNKPTEAFECFKDASMSDMFDQLITYQILLDLLFDNQRYDELIEAFEMIKSRQIAGIKYAKNVVVLVLAACFKQNSQESLTYALKLWRELCNTGHIPMRRAITFCAALAVNKGQPNGALEILSMSRNQTYATVRNLKVVAFIDIGRIDESVQLLKSIITEDTATLDSVQRTFNCDVIEKVKIAVEKLGNSDTTLEFNRILKYFEEHGHISKMTLSEQLCQEIVIPQAAVKRPFDELNKQARYSKFNRNTDENYKFNREDKTIGVGSRRPGLADLQ